MAVLNILHVFRAPVGGLFRHVLDLSREQMARGHRVGMVADSLTGGARAEETLQKLAPDLALGLSRTPMPRHAGPRDLHALAHVMARIAQAKADVVHGHGAKGGAYARLSFMSPRAVRAYTPHGGSLLFGHDTFAGKFYLTTERFLMLRGDLFLFESAYSAAMFRRKIGNPRGLVRIAHNGVSPAEFEPITLAADATDLMFIGELRPVKGIDVLIDAIALMHRDGRPITATLVGDGPDRDALRAQAERHGLGTAIRFKGAMPSRQAQTLGRLMVAPSRAESLPYVVLEAAAAGKPLVTTRVGGIPEIYGPMSDTLVQPLDPPTLARAILRALDNPAEAGDIAQKLRQRVAESFSIDNMVNEILAAYQSAIEALHRAGRR
jgi:glycosyltransferase involved in cell wall biosynthesis